ncbi:MAG: SBBP repeat-containing protein [bacterium]
MKNFKFASVTLVLLLGLVCQFSSEVSAQIPEAWVARYDGAAHEDDGAVAIAVDVFGNVYISGNTDTEAYMMTRNDYITIKYSTLGEELWVQTYGAPGYANDQVSAMVLGYSPLQDIYVCVTGFSDGDSGAATNYDFASIAYTEDGLVYGIQRYNGPGNGDDRAKDLAVDGLGNAYVTGYSDSLPGSAVNYDFVTIKYNATGTQEWLKRYDGPAQGADSAMAITTDGSGNVYVTGASYGTFWGSMDYYTIKYSPTGILLWEARYDAGDDDCPLAIEVDGSGNVYVTGYAGGGLSSDDDWATIKYDASGNQLWTAIYTNVANADDRACDLAVDQDGNVYVTGYGRTTPVYHDYVTIKYNSAGVQQWIKTYDGFNSQDDFARALALDTYGNVYVTGISRGLNSTMNDYITIMYDPAGAVQWITRYNALYQAPFNNDEATCIAVDASQNVYVSGTSYGGSSPEYDFATIKYIQPDTNVFVTLTPLDLAIQIPDSGGRFRYDILLNNYEYVPRTVTFDFWIAMIYPSGSSSVALGPFILTLPGGGYINRMRIQTVAGSAPPGNYYFEGRVGRYPGTIWNKHGFPFVKLTTGSGEWISEWDDSGDSFEEWLTDDQAPQEQPEAQISLINQPNPFNQTTMLSFSLEKTTVITLSIYDIAGRSVAELESGLLDPGMYHYTFNGSGLGSGVYVCLAKAENWAVARKMVLLK